MTMQLHFDVFSFFAPFWQRFLEFALAIWRWLLIPILRPRPKRHWSKVTRATALNGRDLSGAQCHGDLCPRLPLGLVG